MSQENERFDFKKFIAGLNPFNLVALAKSLIYGFRLLIFTAIIIGLIFGIGYFKGKKNAPVQVDMSDTMIVLMDPEGDQHKLVIKDGMMTFDGRPVKVGDIPALRPYGIQLHPKLAAGVSSSGNPAVGIALELAHAYRFNLDALAMVPFIGIGVSYDIRFDKIIKVDNTSIGIAVGKDLKARENAVMLYTAIEF